MVTGRAERVREPRVRAVLAPLAVAAAAAAGVIFVGLVDPNQPGHYPTCPFLMLTGLYCPGCGGLRAVHALAHGDLVAALGLNPFVVVMIPVAVLLWGRWAVFSWQGKRYAGKTIHPAYVWTFLGLMIVFWIVRNVPFGKFLAP